MSGHALPFHRVLFTVLNWTNFVGYNTAKWPGIAGLHGARHIASRRSGDAQDGGTCLNCVSWFQVVAYGRTTPPTGAAGQVSSFTSISLYASTYLGVVAAVCAISRFKEHFVKP